MKTLNEMITVMLAAKQGKEIQARCGDDGPWYDQIGDCPWNWTYYDYRVAIKDPQRLVGYKRPNEIVHSAHTTVANAALAWDVGEFPNDAIKVEFIELTPEIRSKLGL